MERMYILILIVLIYYVNQNNPKGVLHGINLVKKKFRKSDLLINLGDHFLFNFKGNNEIYKNINNFENIIFSIRSKNVKDYGNLYFSKSPAAVLPGRPNIIYKSVFFCPAALLPGQPKYMYFLIARASQNK